MGSSLKRTSLQHITLPAYVALAVWASVFGPQADGNRVRDPRDFSFAWVASGGEIVRQEGAGVVERAAAVGTQTVEPERSPRVATSSGGRSVQGEARPENRLSIPRIGLELQLGSYGDCNGLAPVPSMTAFRYRCAPASVVVIVGHSPGPLSGLKALRAGDVLLYWNGAGDKLGSEVAAIHYEPLTEASKYGQDGSFPHLVLVTCATPDGAKDLVVVGNRFGPIA